MVNWESQSKTPPQSSEDGQIYCFLLICTAFCHVSKNLPLHCWFYVTMNIYFCFYVNTERAVVMVLLMIVNIRHFTYTLSHAHTEAHTHKHTYRGMATTRRSSLVGRGGRKAFVRDKGLVHTKKKLQKNINLESTKRIEHIELPAKLLDCKKVTVATQALSCDGHVQTKSKGGCEWSR